MSYRYVLMAKSAVYSCFVIYFSMCHPNSLKQLSPIKPYEKSEFCDRFSSQWTTWRPGHYQQQFLTISKHLTRNMCWECRKTLVNICWMHLTINDICSMSLCPQKSYNRMLFLYGMLSAAALPHLMFVNDVLVIKLTEDIHSWIRYKMYILDFLYFKN